MEDKINEAVITSALSPDDIAEIALYIIDEVGKNLRVAFIQQYDILGISKFMRDRGASNKLTADLICCLARHDKESLIMRIKSSDGTMSTAQELLPIRVLGLFVFFLKESDNKFLDIL